MSNSMSCLVLCMTFVQLQSILPVSVGDRRGGGDPAGEGARAQGPRQGGLHLRVEPGAGPARLRLGGQHRAHLEPGQPAARDRPQALRQPGRTGGD